MQLRECIRMFNVQLLHTGLEEYVLLSTFRGHRFWRGRAVQVALA